MSDKDAPTGRKTVGGFLVTSGPVPAYGGVRLPEAEVRGIYRQIQEGTPLVAQHDERLPLRSADLTRLELRRTSNGHLGVWIEMEVDAREWERAGGDLLRGWSVAVISGRPGGSEPGRTAPLVQVAVDASFPEEVLRKVERDLSGVFTASVSPSTSSLNYHQQRSLLSSRSLHSARSVGTLRQMLSGMGSSVCSTKSEGESLFLCSRYEMQTVLPRVSS
jgi:hypothetical protein